MKALEAIWNDRLYAKETSYTRHISALFQPDSYADFFQHPDFEEAFRRFTKGDSFRGMDIARLWSVVLNAKHVLSRTDGAVAELGVYKGHCSAVLSQYAQMFDRKMYLADTFTGFAVEQLDEGLEEGKAKAFEDNSLSLAQSVVGNYAGNRWIIGMFPDSVTDEMRDETFAFVSLDCDLYEPIKEGLEFFWPRLAKGGAIFVHDYSSGHWPGAPRAVDEFCEPRGLSGVLLPDKSGSFVLVK